jgi:3-dehydroquinate synthase
MIRVNLGPLSYDIAVVHSDSGVGSFVANRIKGRTAFVVTDENTTSQAEQIQHQLTQTGFKCRLEAVPAGEGSKCLAAAAYLYERLAWMPAERSTVIVAVGGGVVGDLGGFVAATYTRGIPLLMVPTTLLAMVDSAIGGKVGINLPQGKNLVGAVHQPVGVWIDTAFLKTLPEREFRSGLAEVVKYGMILDAEFFAWLEQNSAAVNSREQSAVHHVITHCCALKARVVEQDEREESGTRMVLNFGHTFAHAFETVGGYGTWTHGEAVAAGMVCACRLAERLKKVDSSVADRLVRLLQVFNLPVTPPGPPQPDEWLNVMRRDKKVDVGQNRFVLPTRIGEVVVKTGIEEDLVRDVLIR